MRLANTILPLILSFFAVAKSIPHLASQIVIEDNDLAVPGENPLTYCQSTKDDILAIEHVNLKPNPPAAGTTLTIEAVGTFAEDVEEGAYVNLTVKYGLIRIINQKEDLCTQLKNIDKPCPVKKGKTVITKDVDLPQQIPPGKYTVLADVYTKDDRKITCLQASVTFSRK
ncbi:Phosphatidylglycerol/phosphatidylinositol transfer protein [Lignoscripta atroalba]|nr:Phosphatidylglycerol/phosphatidylinositol transfer protein [Lignoscripta atroalba]